jgi:hypothetical protein
VLNALQTGLSMLGFVPGFGAIADVVNAGISAARGDYIGAGFSLAAAVPFIGDFAAAGKAIRSVTQVSRVSHSAAPVISAARVERAVATGGASSALQGARLGEHLTQFEKYGAQGFKKLESGSIRYYGNLKAAATPGEMSGARLVREWNPASGGKRTWMETLDQSGTVRSVRPETGGPKVHYIFDANGNFTGTR